MLFFSLNCVKAQRQQAVCTKNRIKMDNDGINNIKNINLIFELK